jgi:hypothetical protein
MRDYSKIWWDGVAKLQQHQMSVIAKERSFKYKERDPIGGIHSPVAAAREKKGLYTLGRWKSYKLTFAETNAFGGVDKLKLLIEFLNRKAVREGFADPSPLYEYTVIEHDNFVELARLW